MAAREPLAAGPLGADAVTAPFEVGGTVAELSRWFPA